ncbi:hypothetical protein M8J77_022897 [Diaphorina citri]|nr:hypothetical protein M8J77_022897 [Diaphorina citri]
MLDIGSTFNPNQIWTNIKSFFTTDGIMVVLYKRNLLISANFSLENSSWTFHEESTQEIENDIINIFHARNQILVLDTCGNIFHYNTTSATDVLQKIAHIPSGRLMSACVLISSPIIMCLSYDNHQKMSVQSYNLETRSVKSGAFIKLSNISITTRFIMTPVTMGDTEMVLIGCPDGSVVQYSADCSHFEILHQCTECIVDIFQTDVIYFILSDGRLLEYNNGQVCLKYLPHCVPKRCLHIHPFSLVYSDDHSTFLYNLNESTDEKLAVKGSTVFCLSVFNNRYVTYHLSPIVPMYISYLCDFAIMFADFAIMFADFAIMFADFAILFADFAIMFADLTIMFADFAIMFADFVIMFADLVILFADFAIMFADLAILFADLAIMFADLAIMFAGFAIIFADFAILFADLAIMVADLAILFADLAIMVADLAFADFAIMFADLAIMFADSRPESTFWIFGKPTFG